MARIETKEAPVSPQQTVYVSATQFSCSWDIQDNLNKAETLIRAAHDKAVKDTNGNPKLIVLIQELFATPYFCQTQNADHIKLAASADPEQNPMLKRFQNLARELQVVLPISFYEKCNQAHYNSIIIFDADGTNLGVYRKSHIPDGPGYSEKFYFNPGDSGFKIFQTKYANIGVAICWDQWFPEAARAMVLKGADILLYPTAIGSEPQDPTIDSMMHWRHTMLGHSGANLVPVIASNRVGKEDAITFYGSSFISNHLGQVCHVMDRSTEGFILEKLDLQTVREARAAWGIFRDRRPNLYGALLTLDGETAQAASPSFGWHPPPPPPPPSHHHHNPRKHYIFRLFSDGWLFGFSVGLMSAFVLMKSVNSRDRS